MTIIPYDEASSFTDGDIIYRYQATFIYGIAREQAIDDKPGWTRIVLEGHDLETTAIAIIDKGAFSVRWYPMAAEVSHVVQHGFPLTDEKTARRLFPILTDLTFE